MTPANIPVSWYDGLSDGAHDLTHETLVDWEVRARWLRDSVLRVYLARAFRRVADAFSALVVSPVTQRRIVPAPRTPPAVVTTPVTAFAADTDLAAACRPGRDDVTALRSDAALHRVGEADGHIRDAAA